MYQQQVQYIICFLMFMDAAIVIAGVYIASYVNWVVHNYDWRLDDLNAAYIALFLVFANNFILGRMGLYSDKRSPKFFNTLRDIALSIIFLFMLFVGFLYAIKIDISRLFLALCAGFIFISLAIERALMELHIIEQQRAGFNCHRVLLVGSEDRVHAVYSAFLLQSSWGHKIIGYLTESKEQNNNYLNLAILGHADELEKILTQISVDEVVFALSPECTSVNIKNSIEHCENLGIAFRIVPALYDPNEKANLRVESIQGIPTLLKNTNQINPSGALYKRILDYVVGAFGFFIFLFLYAIIGILIKIDSPGPILFRQKRVGQHGRIFNIYKFRSMSVDAESRLKNLESKNQMKGFMFKIDSDPRVTKIGGFLRKTSLDEFPQFLNVMRGEMSIVGTRPPTVSEVERYETRHRRRISIRPGITGLWQVSGRSKINDFEQVLRLDLEYIDNWRFADDIMIIAKTIVVVLLRKGAS